MLPMESLQGVKATLESTFLYRKHRGGTAYREVFGLNVILFILHFICDMIIGSR